MNTLNYLKPLVLTVIVSLTGCATEPTNNDNYQTPETDSLAKATAAQLAITPQWFLNPPLSTHSQGMFEVATAVNGDLQFAINQATLLAEQRLIKRINSEITSYEMNQIANSGGSNTVSSEQNIESRIYATALHGHQITKREVYPDPKTGEFRVFVLAQLSPSAQADLIKEKIANQLESDENKTLKKYISDLESAIETSKSDNTGDVTL